MLNLLKKTTPWMIASLLVATSVCAQDNSGSGQKSCAPKQCEKPCAKPCPQPQPPTQMCPGQDPCCPPWSTPVLNAAYNYPARTQVRCPWDIYFDASFIYFQPLQDNMELAYSQVNGDTDLEGYNGSIANMDFGYAPGFKVGMGGYFDYDNWDMNVEYTWFHTTQDGSAYAADTVDGALYPVRLAPGFGGEDDDGYVEVDQDWDLKMDIAEVDLGRWYYVGTKLTFRPNFGARAAWIRQDLQTDYYEDVDSDAEYYESDKTRSWAIGPQVGLDANWMLGYGFRFYGCAEADALFTKYTKANTTITFYDASGDEVVDDGFRATQGRIYSVRTHLDLELGFGWGTYLDCNNWYMDFAAGYGFQAFFNQNMFRHFNDDEAIGNSTIANGNLYLQGLTVRFKLDF